MTRDEALNSAVFGVSGVRLNDDECERVFRDLRLAGLAIVPLEPTGGMVTLGSDAIGTAVDQDDAPTLHFRREAGAAYRAMIAAYEQEQGDG